MLSPHADPASGVRRIASAGLIASLGLALACSRGAEESPDAEPRPNVLLFVIDTLRADRLGAYGYARATSPNFDALAVDSALFEHATAQAPWTMPSMASLWSSRHPASHRVVRSPRQLVADLELLPERFLRAGYETVGFNENAIAGSLIGAADGFELLVENVVEEGDVGGPRGVNGFLEWHAQHDPARPYFAWVHGVEPHIPYNPDPAELFGDPPPSRERGIELNALLLEFQALTTADPGTPDAPSAAGRRFAKLRQELLERRGEIDDLYDSVVHLADRRLGRVIAALEAAGELDDTIVIVTSDHGEELGEHGYFLHDHALLEELLHVPLLIRVPGGSARRIAERAQTIDLYPTIAALLGWEPDPAWEGHSLAPLLGEPAPAWPQRTVYAGRFPSGTREVFNESRRGTLQIAAYPPTDPTLKLVRDVDLGTLRAARLDAGEPVPVDPATLEPPLPAAAGALDAWIAARRDLELGLWHEVELTDAQRSAMQALGYVEGDD